MATTTFARQVARIVRAAGKSSEYESGGHFYLKVRREPYMDLVIEAFDHPTFGRLVSVAHYFEQNGDLVPDPEVEMTIDGTPLELRQVQGRTLCRWEQGGKVYIKPRAERDVRSFLAMWGRNLREQGFAQAAKAGARRAD